MAILVNLGQRGFVLKEGFIAPGQQITVDQETAEKLSRVYPTELKMIVPDIKEVEKILEKPVVQEPEVKEEPEVAAVEEQPKKTAKRGRKKKEVQ